MKAYGIPEGFPRSASFTVTAGGTPVPVGHTNPADFASFCLDEPLDVAVTASSAISKAVIRPLSRKITPTVEGSCLSFRLDRPCSLSVEIDGQPSLFVFANPPETDVPSCTDPKVRWFGGDKVHEVGELALESGQTLYIEGGSVLRGSVVARKGSDIAIRGRGIIDGSYWRERHQWRRGVLFEDCDHVSVEGVSIVNPAGWTLVFHACHGVSVANVKEIGEGLGTDGIDVVSSTDVVVEGCFLRNGDDNLVVKAFAPHEDRGRGGDVANVLFQCCALLGHGGCAMEIGHELRTDEIRNVTFRDCDVLCVHGHGAAISIHNADHATVRDIVYDDIRVEHHFARLIDLRVLASRWGRDAQRGRIRNVRLKDVHVSSSEYNAGYTVSLIGGLDAQHDVRDVLIDGLYLDGRRVSCADQIDLYLKHAQGVTFG